MLVYQRVYDPLIDFSGTVAPKVLVKLQMARIWASAEQVGLIRAQNSS